MINEVRSTSTVGAGIVAMRKSWGICLTWVAIGTRVRVIPYSRRKTSTNDSSFMFVQNDLTLPRDQLKQTKLIKKIVFPIQFVLTTKREGNLCKFIDGGDEGYKTGPHPTWYCSNGVKHCKSNAVTLFHYISSTFGCTFSDE